MILNLRFFLRIWSHCFGLLCIFCIPFPFHLFPLPGEVIRELLLPVWITLAEMILPTGSFLSEVSSDSVLMYVLVIALATVSLVLAVLITCVKRWHKKIHRGVFFARIAFRYYLAALLLKYGFDKVFMAQFYPPEPNTLFTPLGELDGDILFWSALGTSHSYNIFLGLMEIFPAVLLLFRKTAAAGALISFGVMAHVVCMNFSFDISVKIFSSFLLFLSAVLIAPHLIHIVTFFSGNPSLSPISERQDHTLPPILHRVIKSCVLLLLILEISYPVAESSLIYSSDSLVHPLHGAYEIVPDSMTTEPLHLKSIKRFFIHRDGYLIIQCENDRMISCEIEPTMDKDKYILTDPQGNRQHLHAGQNHSTGELELLILLDGKETVLRGRELDWKNLPALRPSFHWTIDFADTHGSGT